MKKLLLILLCVPLMFSCGEEEEEKDTENKVIINPGERGVKFYSLGDGLDEETIYKEGEHILSLGEQMIVYDVKTQTLSIQVNGKDANQVQVGLEMHILYNPIPDKIGYLASELGKNYVNKVIKPKISDITLTTLMSYTVDEITSFDEMISEKKDELEDIIEKRMKEELFSYHINIENIFIKDVIISQNIIDAINRKKKKEEELKKMRYID
ncbi:SPFH domain-containing protein [Flavobacteriales bacterium]|nr:SPFH domain-containing protein [Flavobacteriales bacterium]